MKALQTSIRDGIQDVLCPFTDIYITQGSGMGGNSFSHNGTTAVDVRGLKSGVKYPYYAPCDIICAWANTGGQALWQSQNKVRLANGNIDYISFVTAHDETPNYKAGLKIKQGVQMCNMGKNGNATGVHAHIEFAQGKYGISSWQKNKYGIYCLPNEIEFDDVCFMDNTNVISGNGCWKYLKDVPVQVDLQPKVDELQKQVDLLSKQLADKTKELKTSNDTIKAKVAEIALKQQNITDLTLKANDYKMKMEIYKDAVDGIQFERERLEEKILDLNDEIRDLKNKPTDYKEIIKIGNISFAYKKLG